MTDQELCDSIVAENRYLAGKVLPDGSIAVVMQLITTTAIALGVNRESWSRRFCFQDPVLCMQEFDKLKTEDDEPKGWIARRPEMPCDRDAAFEALSARLVASKPIRPSETTKIQAALWPSDPTLVLPVTAAKAGKTSSRKRAP